MKNYFSKEDKINPNYMRRSAKFSTFKQLNLKMALEGLNDSNNKESRLKREDSEQPSNTKKNTGFDSRKFETINNSNKSKVTNKDNTTKNIRKIPVNLRNSVRTKSNTNTALPHIHINLNLNDKNKAPYEKSMKYNQKTMKINEKNTKLNDKVIKPIFTNKNNINSSNNTNLKKPTSTLIKSTIIKKPSDVIELTKMKSQPL